MKKIPVTSLLTEMELNEKALVGTVDYLIMHTVRPPSGSMHYEIYALRKIRLAASCKHGITDRALH